MRRQGLLASAFAAALAAGVGAQQPAGQPQTGQPGDPKPGTAQTRQREMGELGAGQATGDTTSRERQSSAAAGQFILTNASRAGAETGRTGTSGTGSTAAGAPTTGTPPAGTTPSATAGTSTRGAAGAQASYRLIAGTANLQQHVNSRVEITGTLQAHGGEGTPGSGRERTPGHPTPTAEPGANPNPPSGTTPRTGGTPGMSSQAGEHGMQTLRVTSVRQVAASCN
jgi:hypothetical protein